MTGLRRPAGRKGRKRFKIPARRAEWNRGGDGPLLLRGTDRQAAAVRPPNPEAFEEAIFVLREDRMKQAGPQQVLEEARRAADAYLRRPGGGIPRRRGRLWAAVFAAAGLLAAGLVWLLLRVVFS